MFRFMIMLSAATVFLTSTSSGAFAQQVPNGGGSSAATPGVTAAQPAAPIDSSYVLGVGDVIDIGLVGRADLSSRVRISSDGTILLPFIGKMPAIGRTVLELADDIRNALIKGGYFADAVVRAEVVAITSRYATVLGYVGSPGLIPLDRAYRLSELLARVGGRAGAGADYVLLTKAAGGDPQRFAIDALASAGPDRDPVIQHGDKIFIPAAENEVFYVSGEVKSPGAFPISTGVNFRMAIARAGGVSENGSERKLKVFRDGKALKSVKLEDPVKVGDVIKIGERLF